MGIGPTIVRDIERPAIEDVQALKSFGVATVHEAYGRRGLMYGLSPVTQDETIAGPAVTCLNYAGDNLMIHIALKYCKPGDVLVVALTAPSLHGMFGDLLATSCRARGLAGVIIDSGVRDTSDLRRMRFPIWAKGICAAGTQKTGLGWVNVPVSCGGTVVMPGDIVVADNDGVAVVQKEHVTETIAACRRRLENEKALRQSFAQGVLSVESGSLRDILESGCFEII